MIIKTLCVLVAVIWMGSVAAPVAAPVGQPIVVVSTDDGGTCARPGIINLGKHQAVILQNKGGHVIQVDGVVSVRQVISQDGTIDHNIVITSAQPSTDNLMVPVIAPPTSSIVTDTKPYTAGTAHVAGPVPAPSGVTKSDDKTTKTAKSSDATSSVATTKKSTSDVAVKDKDGSAVKDKDGSAVKGKDGSAAGKKPTDDTTTKDKEDAKDTKKSSWFSRTSRKKKSNGVRTTCALGVTLLSMLVTCAM